jgi:leucyl-tRNA synthetase
MIAPITPHLAEELYELWGSTSGASVFTEGWGAQVSLAHKLLIGRILGVMS